MNLSQCTAILSVKWLQAIELTNVRPVQRQVKKTPGLFRLNPMDIVVFEV